MPVQTDDCEIQIRLLVDENYLMDGSTRGVYIMDNVLGTQGARTAGINWATAAEVGDNICWRIEPVNPQSTKTFKITGISSCTAWGFTGHPQHSFDDLTAYVATAQESGNYSYNISISVFDGPYITDDGKTLTIPAQINVVGTGGRVD